MTTSDSDSYTRVTIPFFKNQPMKNLFTHPVPSWTLVLATAITLLSLSIAWSSSSENNALKESIRSREALVPGFLVETSILSPEASCRRSFFIRIKDRMIGSDSCAPSF